MMLHTSQQQLFGSVLPPPATESGLCSFQRLSAEGHLVSGYCGNWSVDFVNAMSQRSLLANKKKRKAELVLLPATDHSNYFCKDISVFALVFAGLQERFE